MLSPVWLCGKREEGLGPYPAGDLQETVCRDRVEGEWPLSVSDAIGGAAPSSHQNQWEEYGGPCSFNGFLFILNSGFLEHLSLLTLLSLKMFQ